MSQFVLSLTLGIIINVILICLMTIYLKFSYVKKSFKTEDSVFVRIHWSRVSLMQD